MKRLFVIICFLIFMLFVQIALILLGYFDKSVKIIILGLLGFFFFVYQLICCLKRINKIEVESDSFKIKNPFFGCKIVFYKDIEEWEESPSIRIWEKNLILKVKKRKFHIINISDNINYETLRHRLATHYSHRKK